MAKPKKGARTKMTTTTKAPPAKKSAAKKAASAEPPETRARVRNRPGGMEGTRWTEAEYVRRGFRRVTLRLVPASAAHLAELEEALATSATEVIRQAIDALAESVRAKKRGK